MLPANSQFQPGEEAFYDRSLRVQIVRTLPGGSDIIVKVGQDSRVVPATSLSSLEA